MIIIPGPPGVSTLWWGPRYDHTLQRNGGSYLYLTVPLNSLQTYKIGVIESMITPLKTTKCLSFWTQMIGTDTQLEAILVRYGQNIQESNQTYSLSPITHGSKLNWTKLSFTIDPKQFPNTTVFSVRIRGRVLNSKSFIALDDIMLSDGQCPNPVTPLLLCKGNLKPYTASQKCDFVYDCPQKDDEDNCGTCDFEKGI